MPGSTHPQPPGALRKRPLEARAFLAKSVRPRCSSRASLGKALDFDPRAGAAPSLRTRLTEGGTCGAPGRNESREETQARAREIQEASPEVRRA